IFFFQAEYGIRALIGTGVQTCALPICSVQRTGPITGDRDGPWGFYSVDETAARYNASSPVETQDGGVAYARFPPSRETRYPGGRSEERRVGKVCGWRYAALLFRLRLGT